MLTTNGIYTLYKIQTRLDLGGYAGCWANANFDYFGSPNEAFSVSGECYKLTGENGVFQLKQARAGLRAMRDRNKTRLFRLVKFSVNQTSVALED